MITLDTSGVLALANDRDRHHIAARDAISGSRCLVASALILGEIGYVVAARGGKGSLLRFLQGFEEGSVLLDCGDTDLPRIRELMTRFADLALGFSDAAVIACAERNGGSVLTFDRADLEVVAGDVPIDLLP